MPSLHSPGVSFEVLPVLKHSFSPTSSAGNGRKHRGEERSASRNRCIIRRLRADPQWYFGPRWVPVRGAGALYLRYGDRGGRRRYAGILANPRPTLPSLLTVPRKWGEGGWGGAG